MAKSTPIKHPAAAGVFAGNASPSRRGMYSSPWCDLFRFAIDSAGLSHSAVADACKVSRGLVAQYATGRARPPVGEALERMVRCLALSEDMARTFVEEAALANSPEEARSLVRRLRADIQELRAAAR